MQVKNVLVIGLKVLGVCLLFAVCTVVGGALSGLDRVARQGLPSQSSSQTSPQTATAPQVSPQTAPRTPPAPSDFLLPFLTFSLCVGIVVSYLILRSSWHGGMLAGAVFVGMYGISTVVTQIEAPFFLSGKLPPGMIRAVFLQGAIATALFAPLAVLMLGKWRDASPTPSSIARARIRASSAAWRVTLLVLAFVFLYMFFGYYVAWQNPAVRQYYGGPEYSSFYAVLRANWLGIRWIYPLQVLRALLYIAFLFPLIRMGRCSRGESALAAALFLAIWTTMLLLPNPLMPPSVARSHFWETLGFSLCFGALAGWLLNSPARPLAGMKGAPVTP